MEISFGSEKLRAMLESDRKITKAFGTKSNEVKTFLADLYAAEDMAELFSLGYVINNDDGCLAVVIGGNISIRMISNKGMFPVTWREQAHFRTVHRVRIESISGMLT